VVAGRPVPGASSLGHTLSCRLLGASCSAAAGATAAGATAAGTAAAGGRWLARALSATSATAAGRRGIAAALRARASKLGRLLRSGGSQARSRAGRLLPRAGRLARGPLGRFGRRVPVVGPLAGIAASRAAHRSWREIAVHTAAGWVGGAAGAGLGTAMCATETVATAGAGAVICPFLIVGAGGAGAFLAEKGTSLVGNVAEGIKGLLG
jgi:hypothetical protein